MKTKLIIFIVLVIIMLSCTVTTVNKNNANILLPEKAIFLEECGNGWIIFEFKKCKFLYHKNTKVVWGYAFANECIVMIEDNDGK